MENMECTNNEQRPSDMDLFAESSEVVSIPENLLPNLLTRLGLGKPAAWLGTQESQLVETLNHQDWSVRLATVRALRKSRGNMPLVVASLVRALADEHVAVRVSAVRALGALKQAAPIEPLLKALKDREWSVRTAAVLALKEKGEYALIAPYMRAALDDEDESVRAAAIATLGSMKEEALLGPMLQALEDHAWSVREAAVLALGELGERAPREPLQAALRDANDCVREAAELVLRQIALPAAVLAGESISPSEQANVKTEPDGKKSRANLRDRWQSLLDGTRSTFLFCWDKYVMLLSKKGTLLAEGTDLLEEIPHFEVLENTPSSQPDAVKQGLWRYTTHAGIAVAMVGVIVALLILFQKVRLAVGTSTQGASETISTSTLSVTDT